MVVAAAPKEWLSEGHCFDFLMDVVRELDISAITACDPLELRDARTFFMGSTGSRVMLTLLIFYDGMSTRLSWKIMSRSAQNSANANDDVTKVIVGKGTPNFFCDQWFSLPSPRCV